MSADVRIGETARERMGDGAIFGAKAPLSRRDWMIDRGRDDGIKVAPPSEPDRRVSRIRLSSR